MVTLNVESGESVESAGCTTAEEATVPSRRFRSRLITPTPEHK